MIVCDIFRVLTVIFTYSDSVGTGGRTVGLGYAADDVRKKFTSYERDTETNLDFAEARMYSSGLGRFTAADPVQMTSERQANPQQINLYAYVSNNPLRFVDPTGEALMLAGNLQDATNSLAQLLGTADALKRITFDPKTNTITVDLTGIDLSQNEGASLLNDVVNATHVFEFSVGPTAQTLAGRVFLAAQGQRLLNLDNNPDDRYTKTDKDKPRAGVDDLIAFDPAADEYSTTNEKAKSLKNPPLWTVMFHELAEAHEKVKNNKQYAEAHQTARDREEKLRNQRPYLKNHVFGAGDGQITTNQTQLKKYGEKVKNSIEKAEKQAAKEAGKKKQ